MKNFLISIILFTRLEGTAQPSLHLYAYSQVFTPGIVPQRDIRSEDGQVAVNRPSANTQYYIYVVTASSVSILPERVWINERWYNIKSYVKVTDENYTLLGFLDAMKDLKKIPDVDIENAIVFFKTYLKQKSDTEIKELVKYALLYPPRVQALLGAVLESINKLKELSTLKAKLNPLSVFNLGIKQEYLSTGKIWNINQDYK